MSSDGAWQFLVLLHRATLSLQTQRWTTAHLLSDLVGFASLQQLFRDVEVRCGLVDRAEHMKSTMGLSSVSGVSHPIEMSFPPGPHHLGTGRQKALAKPFPAVSTQCSAGARGYKAARAEKQHVFKQLNPMTKGKLMMLATHTFPVLDEVQISWLGSFPQDEGLPPSCGC